MTSARTITTICTKPQTEVPEPAAVSETAKEPIIDLVGYRIGERTLCWGWPIGWVLWIAGRKL